MPCDINTRENIDYYDNVLAEISAICRNNDAMYICIARDFNRAFDRKQAWHTQSLKQFMSQENLICGVDFIQSRVDYSYCNSSNNSYSVIDHFVVSKALSTLNVPFECIKCDEYLCTNTKHHDDIQYFHDHIISACIQAATDIPKTSQSSNIPGWNMHVEESKRTSLFWHDLGKVNVKNLTVLIMPLESIILSHYLLINMKNCITLLDMMNSHSVPLLAKILMILSRSVLYLMLTPIVI